MPKGGFGRVYHATNRRDIGGLGKFLRGPIVHVGTPQAALERGGAQGLSHDMELYEATIRTGSTVAPLAADVVANVASGTPHYDEPIMLDTLNDEEKAHAESLRGKYDVYPYVNAAEDVGSVSYAVRPGRLRNVRPLRGGVSGEAAQSLRSGPTERPELIRPGDVPMREQNREQVKDYAESLKNWKVKAD